MDEFLLHKLAKAGQNQDPLTSSHHHNERLELNEVSLISQHTFTFYLGGGRTSGEVRELKAAIKKLGRSAIDKRDEW